MNFTVNVFLSFNNLLTNDSDFWVCVNDFRGLLGDRVLNYDCLVDCFVPIYDVDPTFQVAVFSLLHDFYTNL